MFGEKCLVAALSVVVVPVGPLKARNPKLGVVLNLKREMSSVTSSVGTMLLVVVGG